MTAPTPSVGDQFSSASVQGFPAGVLVLTGRGHVPVERVRPGDVVLTHRNRWRPVERLIDCGRQSTVRVRGSGHYGLRTTSGRRLYVRGDRRRQAQLTEACWRPVSNLATGPDGLDRWATPTNIPALPLPAVARPYPCGRLNHIDRTHLRREGFWWLVGLFVAEGSTSSSYGAGGARNRSVWSVHVDVEAKATAALDALGLNCYRWQAPGAKVAQVVVSSATLTSFLVELAGHGAAGKRLHPGVFGLPGPCRAALFDGALTGDGYQRAQSFTYTTVSRALAFDMRLLALSLGQQASVQFRRTADTRVIRGRTVRCRDLYKVQGCPRPSKPRFRWAHDMAWGRVLGVAADGQAPCYDLDVADDASYVVEGLVVHGGERRSELRERAVAVMPTARGT